MKNETKELTLEEWKELTHKRVENSAAYYLLKKYKNDPEGLWFGILALKKKDTFRGNYLVFILEDLSEIHVSEIHASDTNPPEIFGVFQGRRIEI